MNRFVLRADPPKFDDIPPEDFILTVIMLKAFYKDQEFIRIGYYVQNTIPEEEGDNPDPSKIGRQILTEDTTVHQSQIKWD
ncbi:anti-silencing protein 1-like protein [Tritrichomonas foetus]|uniref:Anti-silencing protein 1-like protein n=1 Tax=Tritrichomonas foetus TaxID=1144522 RepID=A0A1J4L5S0_9EUKA|nr:anti-silencing protein 1-like protein [Tritrichomonas foetus]|eukprot:OHT17356.1 anti-silencing protein 1-like protein [Tritrichomonas foetus]